MNLKQRIKKESENQIQQLHHFSKLIWKHNKLKPIDVQNKCLDAWDEMKTELGCDIIPLVPVEESSQISNLIFGSGNFSTGEFQIKQYEKVREYVTKPPVSLQGIVANKSNEHKCNASEISKKHNIPLVEIDFIDWYHENIDKNERNPIGASRYWYNNKEADKPPLEEIVNRFEIRQNQFHKALGEQIFETCSLPTDIISARGYNFQFCRNIFLQKRTPHINDTHPADLTFIDALTHERLYAGWQSGAVKLMMEDHLSRYRGCLIEVKCMDKISQINELDEGIVLSVGKGIKSGNSLNLNAKEIQNALKIIDDYFFCTIEPTGLILLWGITDKKIPVTYNGLNGQKITIMQKAVIVGNKVHSGVNAWGIDLKNDIKETEEFLFK
ncbi:MAG: hypothetical protein ACTSWY_02730 [Promethearchaeota archaeon]